jgi:hypothetical protein
MLKLFEFLRIGGVRLVAGLSFISNSSNSSKAIYQLSKSKIMRDSCYSAASTI